MLCTSSRGGFSHNDSQCMSVCLFCLFCLFCFVCLFVRSFVFFKCLFAFCEVLFHQTAVDSSGILHQALVGAMCMQDM